MPRIVTRAESGLRRPTATPTRVPLSARTATAIHHDGPKPVIIRNFAEACQRIRDDQNYHMNGNGWADIGYNFLVVSALGTDVDGLIFEGRGRDVVGAHCKDHNTEWIGIQITLGGGQTPSPKSLASARWLHDTFSTAAGRKLGMKGHKDGFPTACPDPKLYAWVRAGMPVTLVARTVAAVKAAAIRVLPRPTRIAPSRANVRKPIASPRPARVLLVVDGAFGPATIRRLQQWAGVTADGKLGPLSWTVIQHRVGVATDGRPGPNTWKAIQRMVGATADGAPGPATYSALQRYLNTH